MFKREEIGKVKKKKKRMKIKRNVCEFRNGKRVKIEYKGSLISHTCVPLPAPGGPIKSAYSLPAISPFFLGF